MSLINFAANVLTIRPHKNSSIIHFFIRCVEATREASIISIIIFKTKKLNNFHGLKIRAHKHTGLRVYPCVIVRGFEDVNDVHPNYYD